MSITSVPGRLEVTPAQREDLPEIARMIGATFGAGLAPGLLRPDFLEWKLFAPRPDWDGPRSYVVRGAGRVAAHACAWPATLGGVRASHLIDWVADPAAPGAGLAVYQHLIRLSGISFVIGGSAQARKLLPKIGFRSHGSLATLARVVRPWKQYRTRPRGAAWREAVRLARNTLWSLTRLPRADGWSAEPGSLPDGRIAYLQACPVAACRYYRLRHRGAPRGHFLLNEVRGQCRIVELRIESTDPRDWQSAYRVAARAAAQLPAACEVTAASAQPWLSEMLVQDGFRLREEKPVVLYDPAGKLACAPPFDLQMTDSDAYFLYSETYPYVT